MKFGYILAFRNPPELSKLGDAEFYAAMFDQIEYLDRSGFETLWTTEHHFVDDGYLSSLMPMMAAVAARTKQLKVGTFVLLAPFQHPLRLAEDAALVDVLSNGRLRLGIGVGYRQEEFDVFEIPRKERLGRTLEAIEIMKRAWTGERFDFEGKYFRFRNARVLPRPFRPNGPELLWGGMNPESIKRCARLGLGFACNLGTAEITKFHEALRALGKDPAGYSVVNSVTAYVADSEDQAWNEIAPGLLYQMELYGKWLAEGGIETSTYRPDPEALRKDAILGPPKRVIARLRERMERRLATELAVSMQMPGLDPRLAMRSLERFGAEVLPSLRKS